MNQSVGPGSIEPTLPPTPGETTSSVLVREFWKDAHFVRLAALDMEARRSLAPPHANMAAVCVMERGGSYD